MPLSEVKIAPGINKQVTPTGAQGKWIDCDNVRFRYGYPEKIGGWEQTTTDTLVGVARDMHIWSDLAGRKYIAIGTNKGLFIYYSGAFYDITPLGTALTSCTFTSSNGSATVTVNKAAHGLLEGDLFLFSSVTLPGGGATGYTTSNFTTNPFQVITRTSDTFTVTMDSNESGTGMSAAGSATVTPYVSAGDIVELSGYGFGTGLWGGELNTITSTTLNGLLQDDTAGTGGSGTSVTLTSTSGFATSGVLKVGGELITYSGISGSDLTGITRGALGSTRSAHSSGATAQDATNFIGWGDASGEAEVTLFPGNWSLDNFGQVLIATVFNQNTFEWDPSATNALSTRAVLSTDNPQQSVMTIVSDRDRHLIHLGTQTTIGSADTQDPMFIRFSDQENRTDYTPTSVNTAGTFRIDSGTRIVGAVNAGTYILILTDTSAYSMRFVGPPFTFGIEQVGSNCGLIGQHAIVAVNGVVYWMGQTGGFYLYDGTVKKIPCSVEDFVFTTIDDGDLGLNFGSTDMIYAGYNSLFNEINWFYPKAGSTQIDRMVSYNYFEQAWSIGSLDRTTYYDKTVFDNPYATKYDTTGTPSFPVIQGVTTQNGATTLYAHEKGTDQVSSDGTATAIVGTIQSGDFEVPGQAEAGFTTMGEFFMKMRRFVPDFRALTGNARVTINLKDFPSDTEASSSLGPFTVSPTTQKVDTRARGRALNIKVENTTTSETWRYGTFRADVQVDGRR